MDWLIEFSNYIIGCFVFFIVFYCGFRFLNKILIDAATDAISDIIEEYKKNNLPNGNKEDEIKYEKNRKKELEQEQSVYQDQVDLEVMQRGFEANAQERPQKKIVGFNIKDMIKGRWTQMLAQKKMQMLQNLNMDTLQNKGINQAILEASRGGSRSDVGMRR